MGAGQSVDINFNRYDSDIALSIADSARRGRIKAKTKVFVLQHFFRRHRQYLSAARSRARLFSNDART